MSTPFSLRIYEPLITKRAKIAQYRKYEVWTALGPKRTLGEFSKAADISMCGLLSRIRSWPAGEYHEKFINVVRAMKANRRAGRYVKSVHSVCSKCGCTQTKVEGTTARAAYIAARRAAKELSHATPNAELSVTGAMGPESCGADAAGPSTV